MSSSFAQYEHTLELLVIYRQLFQDLQVQQLSSALMIAHLICHLRMQYHPQILDDIQSRMYQFHRNFLELVRLLGQRQSEHYHMVICGQTCIARPIADARFRDYHQSPICIFQYGSGNITHDLRSPSWISSR